MSSITPAYTILSLDGGGIRGIIPCKVLEYIEKRLYDQYKENAPQIADLFDLIAGTSTGGILACGLTIAKENGRPRYRAEELLKIYQGESGKKIFSRPTIGRITHFFRSLARSKFPEENIEGVLKEYFGNTRLSEALTDLLITSYNTEVKKPFYFKSSDCRKNPELEDFELWEVSRSTSAAPTYFPPRKVGYQGILSVLDKNYKQQEKKLKYLSLIDGGVFANNPSVHAYIEAKENLQDRGYKMSFALGNEATEEVRSRSMFANVEGDDQEVPIFMLSIGTGYTGKYYGYEEVRKWGMVDWVLPLIDILMQGVSESVHYQMEHLLPPYADQTPRYIRLNIQLDPEHAEMDDASDENTSRLAAYGNRIVESPANQEKLDIICDMLMRRYQQKTLQES